MKLGHWLVIICHHNQCDYLQNFLIPDILFWKKEPSEKKQRYGVYIYNSHEVSNTLAGIDSLYIGTASKTTYTQQRQPG